MDDFPEPKDFDPPARFEVSLNAHTMFDPPIFIYVAKIVTDGLVYLHGGQPGEFLPREAIRTLRESPLAAEDKWLSTPEVADIFGVTVPTIRHWCEAGKLEFRKTPSGRYLVPAPSVARLWATKNER